MNEEYYIGQIFVDDYNSEAAEWCNSNNAYIDEIEPEEGHRRFQIKEVVIPEPTPEELEARYSGLAQAALDDFARTRKYDGIMSACSYANSTDPTFAEEAQYCIALRDETWRKGYEILDKVRSGEMPLPTEEEFLAMLPTADAEWPNERGEE